MNVHILCFVMTTVCPCRRAEGSSSCLKEDFPFFPWSPDLVTEKIDNYYIINHFGAVVWSHVVARLEDPLLLACLDDHVRT